MAKFKVAFKAVMDSPVTAMLSLPAMQETTPFSHLG
jgi:hypothetical protein